MITSGEVAYYVNRLIFLGFEIQYYNSTPRIKGGSDYYTLDTWIQLKLDVGDLVILAKIGTIDGQLAIVTADSFKRGYGEALYKANLSDAFSLSVHIDLFDEFIDLFYKAYHKNLDKPLELKDYESIIGKLTEKLTEINEQSLNQNESN